jgi:hypothetical protein
MAEAVSTRPKVSLNDGLPKKNAKDIIEELREVLFAGNNIEKFFP